ILPDGRTAARRRRSGSRRARWQARRSGRFGRNESAVPMKILLASASTTARKIIRAILEKSGIAPGDVIEVADRKAAFAAFKGPADSPAVAVVDWDLPELDGVALAHYLRSSGSKTGVLFCARAA